jgi:single-strand DNA-binding protein
MSANVNKVILVGNLGADPETKTLPNGGTVCNMRIATTRTWTPEGKQKQEETTWHPITVWGRSAEACAKYLAKGRSVYVEGRLQVREWDDKETGKKRRAHEIVAEVVQFLGGGKADREDTPRDDPGAYVPTAGTQGGDDIPF